MIGTAVLRSRDENEDIGGSTIDGAKGDALLGSDDAHHKRTGVRQAAVGYCYPVSQSGGTHLFPIGQRGADVFT